MMLAAAEILETRKNRSFGRIMDAGRWASPSKAAMEEAVKCALGCRFYAQRAAGILCAMKPGRDGKPAKNYIHYQPIGSGAGRWMPWNFPFFWQVFRFRCSSVDGW